MNVKSILSYVAPAALAMSINVGLPAPAQAAAPGNSVHEFCTAINVILEEQFPELVITFGRCVSFFNSNDEAGMCKLLKDFDALGELGFATQGECVSYLRSLR
jgi:hypothetical protein